MTGNATFVSKSQYPTNLSTSLTNPDGFIGLFGYFPTATNFASSKTTVAMASNPWMKGARWSQIAGTENICQIADPVTTQWDPEIAALTSYKNPLKVAMTRCTASPSLANFDITLAATLTRLDTVINGLCNQMLAIGSTDLEFDPENYASSDISMLFNHDQNANALKNVGAVSRANRCLRMEDFGRQFGYSLWSRIPNAKLHLMFGATQVGGWTGTPSGTQAWTTRIDTDYATSALYNMLPYFCRGLLDACPPTGRILDYCEGGNYGFAGLATLQRVLGYSKNWVSVFFPGDSGLIEKSKTCWLAIPCLYPIVYFKANGTWYAGGDFTYQVAGNFVPGKTYKIKSVGTTTTWTNCGATTGTLGEVFVATNASSGDGTAYNVTDQKAHFTRNALYALQCTPAGYLPAIWVDPSASADPWGRFGAVTNIDQTWADCLNEAISVYQGKTNLTVNNRTLVPLLKTYFTSRADYSKECI